MRTAAPTPSATRPPISLVRTLSSIERRPRRTRMDRAGWPVAGALAVMVLALSAYVWHLHAPAHPAAATVADRSAD